MAKGCKEPEARDPAHQIKPQQAPAPQGPASGSTSGLVVAKEQLPPRGKSTQAKTLEKPAMQRSGQLKWEARGQARAAPALETRTWQ